MSGSGHCRGHIASWPVNNLDRNFSPLDLDGVKVCLSLRPCSPYFSKWHLSAAAHAGPPIRSPLLRLIRRTGIFLMVDHATGKAGCHSR